MPTTIERHGSTFETAPTSIQVPLRSAPGINFVIGAAPLHKFTDGKERINKLVLANTYDEAVSQLGFTKDFKNFPLCEHMYSAFRLYGIAPVVYLPVGPDPEADRTEFPATEFTLVNGRANLGVRDLIQDETLVVRSPSAGGLAANGGDTTPPPEPPPEGQPPPEGEEEAEPAAEPRAEGAYVLGTDYIFQTDNATEHLILVRIDGGAIATPNATVEVSGFRIDPSSITEADIIGGVDSDGNRTGIAAIEDVFGRFGIIPGTLLSPGYAHLSTVFAVAIAAVSDINGCFKGRFAADVDVVTTGTINKNPNDVPAWKISKNMIHERADLLYLRPKLGDDSFNFSSHWGPLMQLTDATIGGNVPFVSASNKRMQMDAAVHGDGTEIILSRLTAEFLNVQAGVIVPLRWGTFGWRSFGNGTSAVPTTTDVVNMFTAIRRMFDYVGNSMVLTTHATWLDAPGNRRAIDSIVNSFNAWGASLQSQGAVLSFRVEFRHDENSKVDLLSGKFLFHVWIGGVVPMQWIHYRLEYDVAALDTLFEFAEAA